MNAQVCGSQRPSFGPRPDNACVAEHGHDGDHRNARGETWKPAVLISKTEMDHMLAEWPDGFKMHDGRNW